jgi:Cdc6-like AAA superfamily ATPase
VLQQCKSERRFRALKDEFRSKNDDARRQNRLNARSSQRVSDTYAFAEGFNRLATCLIYGAHGLCDVRNKGDAMAIPDIQTADTVEKIFIGKGEQPAWLTLALANRHGLVTGATGTGKTVSLQVMAEGFARAGVPVFAADIKGDLSGISEVGEAKDFILKPEAGDPPKPKR